MILVIDVCAEKLHRYEFVKPVVDVLEGEEVLVLHYNDLMSEDLEKCDKVIICGTSLKDDGFLKDIDKFDWLKDFDKPVLGICAGFQIIGLTFGGELKKGLEIGFYFEKFIDPFLGLEGEPEVYHLHNNYVDVSKTGKFIVFSKVDNISQAIESIDGEIYGVLFHPEVRNKEMILRFAEK